MKKIIISLVFLFTLTGCWNYHELNNYSIVTGVAIDKGDDNYEVSVLIANSPKSSESKEENSSRVVVYSGNGDSIYTAIKDIGLISAKELYLGHFAVLIISEDIAKSGINEVIDLFLRESSSKKNFYIAIARDCKAKDALKIITPLSNFPSQNIADNLTSTSKLQGTISNISFNQLLMNIKRNGIDNAINSINIIGNIEEGSSKENVEKSEPETYVKLSTLGLFNDDKLVYWTNKEESTGINIIRNKAKELYVEVKYQGTKIIIETTDINTKIKPSLKNDMPNISIDITGESKIVEVIGDIDLENDKVINSIKKLMNESIKDYVNKGINAGVENKSDAFGFGLLFYQNYPEYYKNSFNDDLDKIKISANSNVIIKTKGSALKSLEDKND